MSNSNSFASEREAASLPVPLEHARAAAAVVLMAAKLSKASVNYRTASPLNLRRRCGTCTMYRSGGSCTLVAGRIVPTAVCDRWAGKAGRA